MSGYTEKRQTQMKVRIVDMPDVIAEEQKYMGIFKKVSTI
jgi:hypothetical protein